MAREDAIRRGLAPIFIFAVTASTGCGGALVPPDGGGGTGGGAMGGGFMLSDASSDLGGAIGDGALGDVTGMSCVGFPPAMAVAGASCQYVVPDPPCGAERSHAVVVVDQMAIPRDTSHTSGWDFTDATFTAIEIYGPTCDALVNGSAASVFINFTYPIP